MRILQKLRRHVIQFRELADWRAGDDARPSVPDIANYAAPVTREPEIDAWVEDLVRRRIPAEGENQSSRRFAV